MRLFRNYRFVVRWYLSSFSILLWFTPKFFSTLYRYTHSISIYTICLKF
nr:MAG TPA: hypothetical protein [Caudoviricetes sp.]